MGKTKIQWTDRTWNPTRGCSRVSEGCRNCYAERQAARFSGAGKPFEGFANATLTMGPRWTGKVALVPEKLDEPLRWKKPARIFVNSMSDLFHEKLSNEDIAAVFGVMAACQNEQMAQSNLKAHGIAAHVFQVLTKRPKRMLDWFRWIERKDEFDVSHPVFSCGVEVTKRLGIISTWTQHGFQGWPLPNVWLGVSVEDQATADERIPLLLKTPAAVRFVSYEPALGPVDFEPWLDGIDHEDERLHYSDCGHDVEPGPRLDWLIVGGESGPHARPFDVKWARSTVEDCKAAGVACFVKQMGRWVLGDDKGFNTMDWLLADGRGFVPPILGPHVGKRPENAIGFSLYDAKGGDPEEWPKDIRVREFPS